MKTHPFVLIPAMIMSSAAMLHAQSVAGLDQLVTTGPYTNAAAASIGYGINGLGSGYFLSNVTTHFNLGDFYEPLLTFSGLVIGQEYSVTILVGNYSASQQSFGGLFLEETVGMSDYTADITLRGPAISPGVTGWSDGNGAPVTWQQNSFTFIATGTVATGNEYQDGVDLSATLAAATSAGYAGNEIGVDQIAIGGISIVAVPEVSGSILVGLAGTSLLLRRRRL